MSLPAHGFGGALLVLWEQDLEALGVARQRAGLLRASSITFPSIQQNLSTDDVLKAE